MPALPNSASRFTETHRSKRPDGVGRCRLGPHRATTLPPAPSPADQSWDQLLSERFESRARRAQRLELRLLTHSKPCAYRENYTLIERAMGPKDILFILGALKRCSVFADLSDEDFEELVPKMVFCGASAGDWLFAQDDPASSFFVLERGNCEVAIGGRVTKTLTRGDTFGELALLCNSPRSAGIRVATEARFWALDRESFRAAVRKVSVQHFGEIRACLDQVKFFGGLTDAQKDLLASHVVLAKFQAGEVIFNQGETANSYYVIREGQVECWDGECLVRTLKDGEAFGEQALLSKVRSTRALSVKAQVPTTCLVLARETLLQVLGDDVEVIAMKNSAMWAIDRHPVFSRLSATQKIRWINSSEVVIDHRRELGAKGQPPHYLYIVISGRLSYGDKMLEVGDIFGEEFLRHRAPQTSVLAHGLLAESGTFVQIPIGAFKGIIGGDLDRALERNEAALRRRKSATGFDFRAAAAGLTLADLLFIGRLGEGQSSQVLLVQDPKRSKLFALKVVLKNTVLKENLQKHVRTERQILEDLSFPFIVRLYKTFRDDRAVYFLTEFIRGTDFFDLIRQIDLLKGREARFYIAGLLLSLEYLHGLGIVYRDLKPENILVDEQGFPNLIDFGTAKVLKDPSRRTHTVIGTPHYMAPEALSGKGFGQSVDLWALGVILFELMCGYVPFGEDEVDPIAIYALIRNSKVRFPQFILTHRNAHAVAFLKILLSKVPEARLRGGFANLKSHLWFEGFNWADMFERTAEAPYLPRIDPNLSDEWIAKKAEEGRSLLEELEVR